MKIAAFIPIKLNNERLPGKNTMLLGGRPMCKYIFDTLLQVPSLTDRYVYCSDPAILPYIPSGITFLQRDPYLDGFTVRGLEIIEYFTRDVIADIYLLTHVTHPFTTASSLENALQMVISGKYDSAFSARQLQDYCWYQNKPVNYDLQNIPRTQELEPVYMETSSFFIFTRDVFMKFHQRIGKKPYMQLIDSLEAVDVDTRDDFTMAQVVAEYKQRQRNGQ